jgi:hypothetical protein
MSQHKPQAQVVAFVGVGVVIAFAPPGSCSVIIG